jgi:hypothetical protein
VTNAHNNTPPAVITKIVSEKPNTSIGESFGLIHPQVDDCRVPSTTAPRPVATRTLPTTSSLGGVSPVFASPIRWVIARMNSTSTTSPTNTTRQDSSVVAQPPRIGPMAIPAPATPPITA